MKLHITDCLSAVKIGLNNDIIKRLPLARHDHQSLLNLSQLLLLFLLGITCFDPFDDVFDLLLALFEVVVVVVCTWTVVVVVVCA